MTRLLLLTLLLLGCGRGELQGPPAEAQAQPPAPEPVAPACIPSGDSTHSRRSCETVSALEITSVRVLNADGTSPWTHGPPVARAAMRNTSGDFLSYPGVKFEVSWPSLATPRTASDALYGLEPCGQTELGMSVGDTLPSGVPVTFTAKPMYISGEDCPLAFPAVSVTATAP